MADSEPINITFHFDTSEGDRKLGELEERAKKGVTVPIRAETGAPTAAAPVTPGPAARPVPTTPPPAPYAVDFLRQVVAGAAARGDTATVDMLTRAAAERGIPLAAPTTPRPSPGIPPTVPVTPAEGTRWGTYQSASAQAEINRVWASGDVAGATRTYRDFLAQGAVVAMPGGGAPAGAGPLARGLPPRATAHVVPPVPGVYPVPRAGEFYPPLPGAVGPGGYGPGVPPGFVPPMPGGFGPGGEPYMGPGGGAIQYGAPIGPPVPPGGVPPVPLSFGRQLFKPLPGGRAAYGLYFSLLFGLGEVAKTQRNIRETGIAAGLAGTDLERLKFMQQGAQPQGFYGEIAALGKDIGASGQNLTDVIAQIPGFGGLGTPRFRQGFFDSPAKVSETIMVETARRQSLDLVRDSQFARGQQGQIIGGIGQSEFRQGMIKARVDQAQAQFKEDQAIRDIQGELGAQTRAELPKIPGLARYFVDTTAVAATFGYSRTRNLLEDEPTRAAKRAEILEHVRTKSQADDLRAATEADLQRRHDLEIATTRAETGRISDFAVSGGRSGYELKLRELQDEQKLRTKEALATSGWSDAYDVNRNYQAKIDAFVAGFRQDQIAALDQIAGETEGARLTRTGSPLAGARATITAKYKTAFDQVDRSSPLYFRQMKVLADARQEEYEAATQTDEQRIMRLAGAHEAATYEFARKPFAAQLAAIEGERMAALRGVTDPDEIRRINRAAQDKNVRAALERADQQNLIGLSLTTREAQVKALLARDPTSAAVAGIIGQTRGEEYRLRAAGFDPEANRALKLGIEQLKLTRREYVEGFTGVQVSQQQALGIAYSRKTAEDPATVLNNIEKGIKDLGTGGTVPQINQAIAQPIINAIQALGTLIGQYITP